MEQSPNKALSKIFTVRSTIQPMSENRKREVTYASIQDFVGSGAATS